MRHTDRVSRTCRTRISASRRVVWNGSAGTWRRMVSPQSTAPEPERRTETTETEQETEHVEEREGILDEREDVVLDLRSEEHTSELQSRRDLVCRLLLEKKKK